MAIKRYIASADNTITNAFDASLLSTNRATGSNMGRSDVLEVFSIYGQVSGSNELVFPGESQELSRVILNFPVSQLTTDRTNNTIPASGSISWYLRMFNAEHAETVPREYSMIIQGINKSWEEGDGLDMDNYTDKTYDAIGSNWIKSSNTTSWTSPGGDYLASPSYTVSFGNKGTENLEVDISDIVEDWMTTLASATALLNSFDASSLNNGDTIVLKDTAQTSHTFTINTSTDATINNIIGVQTAKAGPNNELMGDQIEATINDATSTCASTITAVFTAPGGDPLITFTQDVAGKKGNTTNTDSAAGLTLSSFTGGTGVPSYGVGVRLSASYEAYYSSSTGLNTGSILQNTGGSKRSYYTKKFFARESEFFFKRPILEARWDDAKKDNRGDFYYSSSLAPASDNLNTLYLYNYIRGKLTNIPSVGTENLLLSLYSGSSDDSEVSGSKILLPAGGGVSALNDTNVTGSYVSTGIYSATFAVTAAATPVPTLYDVWHSGGIEFNTGSITTKTFDALEYNGNNSYVVNIKNMKKSYSTDDTGRFRLFVRNKNWSPTMYTVANATAETLVIPSASYKVVRIADNQEVIEYGTGSTTNHTQLSYDSLGNYFNLDMSMLEPGYMYGIKLAFYDDAVSDHIEQKHTFKFRVEEDNE